MINEKFSTGMSGIYLSIGVVYEVKLGVYEVHNIPQMKIGTFNRSQLSNQNPLIFHFRNEAPL